MNQFSVLLLLITSLNYLKMFRSIPTNSKLCMNHDLKRTWRIHEQKLKEMKSSVGKERPPHFRFLDQRPKKAALKDVRNIEINNENSHLLRRIKELGKRNSNEGCGNNSTERVEKGRSLNSPFRKRVLVQIFEENMELLKRIQQKKSAYNVKKWEQDRKKVEKNITILSEFPYKNYPCSQTRVNLWMTEEDYSKKSRVIARNSSDVKQLSLTKSELMHSGTEKLGDSYYLAETYLNKKIFSISLENLQNQLEKYRMELSEEEVLPLIRNNFQGNIRKMIQSLVVDPKAGTCELKIPPK